MRIANGLKFVPRQPGASGQSSGIRLGRRHRRPSDPHPSCRNFGRTPGRAPRWPSPRPEPVGRPGIMLRSSCRMRARSRSSIRVLPVASSSLRASSEDSTGVLLHLTRIPSGHVLRLPRLTSRIPPVVVLGVKNVLEGWQVAPSACVQSPIDLILY